MDAKSANHRRRRWAVWAKRALQAASLSVSFGALVFVGCNKSDRQTLVHSNDYTVTHYDENVQQVEYTPQHVDDVYVSDAANTPAPRTVAAHTEGNDPLKDSYGQATEFQPITLDDVIHTALQNSKVMRDLGGMVLRSPDRVQTRYASAIQYTDPRFGPEAALSSFDAQFRTSGNFENNDRDLNNSFFGGGTTSLVQDTNAYVTELSKQSATGARFALRNLMDYDSNNAPGNRFTHAWNFNMEAEARQPLLQGGGLQFNRIAGPNAVPGFINGYEIARVNNDISEVEFEMGLRDFVSDLINSYWDLYYAYRDLDAKKQARDEAVNTWRKVKANDKAAETGYIHLAAEQYYRFQDEVQNALAGRPIEGTQTTTGTSGGNFRATGGVYQAERRLRLLMGLAATDSTLLRPATDACNAELAFHWEAMRDEALARRPELRRQRLKLKRREKELVASRNFLSPRLDAVAQYRWRGFGNDLYSSNSGVRNASAVNNLADGSNQEWQLGVEFAVPLGFRRGHAAVQNAELMLSRERALLKEQERQVVHDLSSSTAELDRAFLACRTNMNRYFVANDLYETLKTARKANQPIGLDRFLDAQRRMVEAKTRYFQSLSEYAVAIKNVNYQKGSLLDYFEIYVAGGSDSPSAPGSNGGYPAHGGAIGAHGNGAGSVLPPAPESGSTNGSPAPTPVDPLPKNGNSPKQTPTPQEKYDGSKSTPATPAKPSGVKPAPGVSASPQIIPLSANRYEDETPPFENNTANPRRSVQQTRPINEASTGAVNAAWDRALGKDNAPVEATPSFDGTVSPRIQQTPPFEAEEPLFDGKAIDFPEANGDRVGSTKSPRSRFNG